MAPEGRSAVPGTEPPLTSMEVIGEVEPGTRLEVSVLVRPRRPLEEPIGEQPVLSREEFAASYGADRDDLASIAAFARAHGLQVVESSEARRHIALRGTAAAFGEAFGIRIRCYRDASGRTFRAPDGPISVPTELAGIVQGVFGFDNRPAAQPH